MMCQCFMRILLRFGVARLCWIVWPDCVVLCWIVLGGNKRQNLSVCLFCFVAKCLFSAGELNFSQYRERALKSSLFDRGCIQSLVFSKFSLS